MVETLVLLGAVAPLGAPALQIDAAVRSVFRQAHAAVRIFFVELIKEGVVVLQLPGVPAEVQIVRQQVRNGVSSTRNTE